MSMVFNMQPTQMKTDAEFTKRRLDAATMEPNYWRFSKLQLNTGEYVPTMAMLMYYLFSVYKASTLPPIAAYGCIISTAGAYSFVVGMATQAGTIWGASLKPPFAPPPLRALGALGRYAGKSPSPFDLNPHPSPQPSPLLLSALSAVTHRPRYAHLQRICRVSLSAYTEERSHTDGHRWYGRDGHLSHEGRPPIT
jgi:hypothetical protein